jgi:hypothetical protein
VISGTENWCSNQTSRATMVGMERKRAPMPTVPPIDFGS